MLESHHASPLLLRGRPREPIHMPGARTSPLLRNSDVSSRPSTDEYRSQQYKWHKYLLYKSQTRKGFSFSELCLCYSPFKHGFETMWTHFETYTLLEVKCIVSDVSPWYNRAGWLGVKHQLTNLVGFSVALRPDWETIRFIRDGDPMTATRLITESPQVCFRTGHKLWRERTAESADSNRDPSSYQPQ